MRDQFGREVNYLRLSITDNCNLRCIYCMPEDAKNSAETNNLTIDEYFKTAKIFSKLGIKKVRITGGEPLVRKGIDDLVKKIHSIKEIEEIAITTNGLLLPKYLDGFIENGVTSLNVSIDSINNQKFKQITRGGDLEKVVSSINKATKNGIKVKLNVVIIKGVNDSEIIDLIKFAIKNSVDIRFIELMPIGCARHLKGMKSDEIIEIIKKSDIKILEKGVEIRDDLSKSENQIVYKNELINDVKNNLSNKSFIERNSATKRNTEAKRTGPAEYISLVGTKTKVGFISPLSSCFCESCNRIRVTSDGKIKQCLYYRANIDLKEMFREKKLSTNEIIKIVKNEIYTKNKKHAFNNYEINTEKREERIMSSIGG